MRKVLQSPSSSQEDSKGLVVYDDDLDIDAEDGYWMDSSEEYQCENRYKNFRFRGR